MSEWETAEIDVPLIIAVIIGMFLSFDLLLGLFVEGIGYIGGFQLILNMIAGISVLSIIIIHSLIQKRRKNEKK